MITSSEVVTEKAQKCETSTFKPSNPQPYTKNLISSSELNSSHPLR